jgi:phosphoglycolate phosphatase-like HAD superfamily hydrolase
MLTVGFDLDMTLVDSGPGIRASMGALAEETGTPIDVDVVLGRLGPKLEWEIAQWFPPAEIEAMSARYRELYWDRCVGEGTILLPGARAAVDAVHASGGHVIVVTAKSESLALRCLDSVRLDADAVVGHVYGEEKRDALLEHTAGIYVGDTVTDIESAMGASAIAVGVTTGPDSARALLSAGADVVFDTLDEFPGWLTTIS